MRNKINLIFKHLRLLTSEVNIITTKIKSYVKKFFLHRFQNKKKLANILTETKNTHYETVLRGIFMLWQDYS